MTGGQYEKDSLRFDFVTFDVQPQRLHNYPFYVGAVSRAAFRIRRFAGNNGCSDSRSDSSLYGVPRSGSSSADSSFPTSAPEGPEIYSSYAHMVSLDVARGVADFDYFDMLRGADAVEWLVEHEGYSEADAQAAVAEFADSEFIEKNTNPQIRHIDLTDIPLKLMFRPDGTMVEGAEPVDSEYADMYVLYELDRSLVLDTFFYYITAEDGEAVSVEQVYWP